jgi:hypothetical protein
MRKNRAFIFGSYVYYTNTDDTLAWIIREGGRREGLLCYKHVV